MIIFIFLTCVFCLFLTAALFKKQTPHILMLKSTHENILAAAIVRCTFSK